MSDVILTFVHISDTHINNDPSNHESNFAQYHSHQGAKALVQVIKDSPFHPDFVLHTGDVVFDPVLEAYDYARSIFSEIPYPIYYLAGNHDEHQSLQLDLIQTNHVVSPLHYEVEVNGVQIVCVDSNGPAKVPAGNITPEQLTWLNKICTSNDERPLIIATHHNPLPVGVPWLDEWMRITNGEQFHNIILQARHRLRGVFYGHIHQNTSIYRDGVLYSSALSSWVQFHSFPGMTKTQSDTNARPGFSVVTLTQETTFIRRYWFDVESSAS